MRAVALAIAAGLAAHAACTAMDMEAAWRYSQAHRGLSLIVIQNGRTLMERYAADDGPGVRHKIYSGTKGLWCVAAVAAQADGLLSLDEPVSATIPEWRDRDITLRQFLNFTAGIDPGFHLHSDDVPDRNAYALALPRVAPPGRAFIYGPGQIQIFGEVLRRKLAGRESEWHYLERRVLAPAGLGSPPHKTDAAGNPLLATGVQLTAREWAQWGRFLLSGARGALPPGALRDCLRGTSCNPAFGMGFWLNGEAPGGRAPNIEEALEPKWWRQDWRGVCVCREAPPDLFVSLGSMGQRIYVIPSLKLVVTRLSDDSKFSDEDFLRLLLAR